MRAAPPSTEKRNQPPLWALVIALLVGVWMSQGRGLLSSNDGSHLALARALALRSQTSIDADAWMTLGVVFALREGHYYSDRPPGTAFAALPAAIVGDALDESWLARSRRSGEPVYLPAAPLYASTKQVRSPGSPSLAAFQGTAFAINLHAGILGN